MYLTIVVASDCTLQVSTYLWTTNNSKGKVQEINHTYTFTLSVQGPYGYADFSVVIEYYVSPKEVIE